MKTSEAGTSRVVQDFEDIGDKPCDWAIDKWHYTWCRAR
jgi:hypothetical protein